MPGRSAEVRGRADLHFDAQNMIDGTKVNLEIQNVIDAMAKASGASPD
jgi:hypothetical protein